MSKNESRYYLSNKELLPELQKYVDTGVASEKLGEQITQIARNLANKSNYNGYSWIEDMVSEAVLTCLKYSRNFDYTKSSNAFAYLTTICNSSFKGYLNKEKRHSKIKDSCYKVANSQLPLEMLSEESNNKEEE